MPNELDPYIQAIAELRDHSGAADDQSLVALWLTSRGSRSKHTEAAYRADAGAFLVALAILGADLRTASLSDLQGWASALPGAPATRKRRMASVRSLLSFAHSTGYSLINVGASLALPEVPNDLAQRILTEKEVTELITSATPQRDRPLVAWLYYTGCRAAEANALSWEHLTRSRKGTVATLHGKGGRTRHIKLAPQLLEHLKPLGKGRGAEAVFLNHRGNRLTTRGIHGVVARVADESGVDRPVTPHWLRHAHVSHALDRGAPPHLVQQNVGHTSLNTTTRYAHANPEDGSGLYLR